MKHNQASPPMKFEELVQSAKVSETPLSAHDLERMLKALQARVAVDPQLSSLGTTPPDLDAPRPRFTKASVAGSLGGLGLLAALALTYATQSDIAKPDGETTSLLQENEEGAPLSEPPHLDAQRGTTALGDDSSRVNNATPASDPPAEQTTSLNPTAERQTTRKATANSRALRTSTPVTLDTSAIPAPAASAPAAPAPTVPTTRVVDAPRAPTAPSLDASLTRLEQAERELRSGQPSEALITLAIPVTPSLSSRAEALRAVALCQSGNKAAGAQLAQAHLTRNPRSPYAKRLSAACGSVK